MWSFFAGSFWEGADEDRTSLGDGVRWGRGHFHPGRLLFRRGSAACGASRGHRAPPWGSGEETEISVEVAGFPAPGVGGVAVLELGYDPNVREVQGSRGTSGFTVLCSCVDNLNGRVKFIVVNPTEGVSSGPVAALKVRRRSLQDPRFSLTPSALELVDGNNVKIPSATFGLWLGGAPRYFAGSGR